MVHRATNERTARDVAIKCLHVQADPRVRARLLREARAAGRIRHPNVADVIDVVDDPVYGVLLVLELLEAENLAQRIARVGPLGSSGRAGELEALRIGLDVAEALVAAHAAGVIHRDLKPSNVMLVREGDRERAKVLDFGLAHFDDEPDRLTRSGEIVGTPHYMAPEQVLGARADGRWDVWALGALLYELLSGVPPHERASTSAVLVAIATEPVPPLRTRAPAVSSATCEVVEALLAHDPSGRPDALEAARRIAARLDELERIDRFTATPRDVVTPVVAPEVVAPRSASKSDSKREKAARALERRGRLAILGALTAVALAIVGGAIWTARTSSSERPTSPPSAGEEPTTPAGASDAAATSQTAASAPLLVSAGEEPRENVRDENVRERRTRRGVTSSESRSSPTLPVPLATRSRHDAPESPHEPAAASEVALDEADTERRTALETERTTLPSPRAGQLSLDDF